MSAFILNHGSFNPVHRQHLEMMVRARECLQDSGYTVVRGILAITPRRRLISKGAAAVLDHHRLAALQLGCDAMPETAGWLTAEARGRDCGSGKQLVRMLEPELLQEFPGATLFKVIGADVAARYPAELAGPTIVVCRAGSTEEVRRLTSQKGRKRTDLFVIDELSGEECSSTKLRAALEADDLPGIERLCPAGVAKYLMENRDTLYSSSARDHGHHARVLSSNPVSQDMECSKQKNQGAKGGKSKGVATVHKGDSKSDKSSGSKAVMCLDAPGMAMTKADADELHQLKQDIMNKKAELKELGMSNGQCNKDQQVVAWVARMQELRIKITEDPSLAGVKKQKQEEVSASQSQQSGSKSGRRWGKSSSGSSTSKDISTVHDAALRRNSSNCQVVGISGASHSGKSTLARNLLRMFGEKTCMVVGQDDFRLGGNQVSPDSWVQRDGCWLRDWETPNQTDWLAFCEAVRKATATYSIVLVEGFCLLHDDAMCKLLQGFIWVETEKDTCSRRRKSYPKHWDPTTYFEECIWAAHLRYRAAVFGEAQEMGVSGKSAQFAPRALLAFGYESQEALCHQFTPR
mmetsp:Transcript_110705/g.202938  ORF Transcript_110705/g.202938 Transcript_110705/m.202938 type:complete len:576 (-) Transcript_110705:103-1830(-)